MKTIKIILSVVTIIFAAAFFLKILSSDISHPLMLTSLATLLLIRSYEYKISQSNGSFILTLATALFTYIVVIFNVFIEIGRAHV